VVLQQVRRIRRALTLPVVAGAATAGPAGGGPTEAVVKYLQVSTSVFLSTFSHVACLQAAPRDLGTVYAMKVLKKKDIIQRRQVRLVRLKSANMISIFMVVAGPTYDYRTPHFVGHLEPLHCGPSLRLPGTNLSSRCGRHNAHIDASTDPLEAVYGYGIRAWRGFLHAPFT
jgi:hypothetical protein